MNKALRNERGSKHLHKCMPDYLQHELCNEWNDTKARASSKSYAKYKMLKM